MDRLPHLHTPHPPWHRLGLGLALACLAVAVTGCSWVREFPRLFGGETTVRVVIAQDLNDNAPVAVDMVIAYEQSDLDTLLATTSQDWFSGGRESFLRSVSGKRPATQTWRWEWVPGQSVSDREVDYRVGAVAGVLFVSYSSAGNHRQRFDPRHDFTLDLGAKGFTIRVE